MMPQQRWCTTFVGGPLLSHYIYRAPLQVTLAHQGLGIMSQMPEQMWRKMSTGDVENVKTGTLRCCMSRCGALHLSLHLSLKFVSLRVSLSLSLSLSPSLSLSLSLYVSHFTGICRAPLQVTLAHQELKKPPQMTHVVHYICRWSLSESEAFTLSLHL